MKMVLNKTIIKNGSFLFVGNILSRVFAFLLIVMLGRLLGDEGLGLYAFSFAVVEIFGLVSEFGIYVFVVREITTNRKKLKTYLNNYLTSKIVLSLSFLIVYIFVVYHLPFIFYKKIIMILASICYILYFMNNPFFSVYQALEKMEYEAILRTSDSFLSVVFAFLSFYFGYGLVGVLCGIIFSRCVFLFVNYLIVRKNVYKPRLAFNFKIWKKFIVKSLPFFMTTVLNTIYFQVDSVMLSFMKGDQVVGWYNAAYKMVSALTFIPSTITYTIYPVMARYFYESKQNLKELINLIFKFLFIVIWPITIGTFLLADRFIFLIFGSNFVNSGIALQILIFAELFVFFNLVMVIVTNSIEKEKEMSLILLGCAVFNIICNFFVIPKYSYIGAGFVTLLTELINFSLSVILIWSALYFIPFPKLFIKSGIAGLFMGIIAFLLSKYFTSMFGLIPIILISGLTYVLFLFIFKDIRKKDFFHMKNMVTSNSKIDNDKK